jgi:hypothetical protein
LIPWVVVSVHLYFVCLYLKIAFFTAMFCTIVQLSLTASQAVVKGKNGFVTWNYTSDHLARPQCRLLAWKVNHMTPTTAPEGHEDNSLSSYAACTHYCLLPPFCAICQGKEWICHMELHFNSLSRYAACTHYCLLPPFCAICQGQKWICHMELHFRSPC